MDIYKKGSKITTPVVGIVRFGVVVIEAFHSTLEAMDAGRTEKEGAKPALLLPALAIVATGASFAGSIAQLCLFETARTHSNETRAYLEDHNTSKVSESPISVIPNERATPFNLITNRLTLTGRHHTVGHSIALVGNGCACFLAGYDIISIKDQRNLPATEKGISLAISVLVSVGSFGEIIGVHLVPDGGGQAGSLGTTSDCIELGSTTFGLVTAFGAFAGGHGRIVAMAAGTFDGILTLLSLINGKCCGFGHFNGARLSLLIPHTDDAVRHN